MGPIIPSATAFLAFHRCPPLAVGAGDNVAGLGLGAVFFEDACAIAPAAADADGSDVTAVIGAQHARVRSGRLAASGGEAGASHAQRQSDAAGGFQEISAIY